MKILIGAAAMVVAPVMAWAGVVFEVETTYHSGYRTGEESESMLIYVEGKNLKMSIAGNRNSGSMPMVGGSVSENASASASDSGSASNSAPGEGTENELSDEMIYRSDRREMVVVDHENKEYYVIDESFVHAMLGNIGGGVSGANNKSPLAGLLDQIPAENREMVEGLLGELTKASQQNGRVTSGGSQRGYTPLKIRRGARVTTNGYPAANYTLSRNGQTVQELSVADWSDLGVGSAEQETFESYFEFFAEMEKLSKNSPFGSDEDANFFESMDQIGGFPVAGRHFEGGEVDEEWSLRSSRRRTLDPDEFEPPAGYRLRTMGGF